MTTKKRFHYYPKSQMIVDVFTGKRYFGHDAICKLLNIFYEENEQLKQSNKELLLLVDTLKEQNIKFKTRLNDLGVEYYD